MAGSGNPIGYKLLVDKFVEDSMKELGPKFTNEMLQEEIERVRKELKKAIKAGKASQMSEHDLMCLEVQDKYFDVLPKAYEKRMKEHKPPLTGKDPVNHGVYVDAVLDSPNPVELINTYDNAKANEKPLEPKVNVQKQTVQDVLKSPLIDKALLNEDNIQLSKKGHQIYMGLATMYVENEVGIGPAEGAKLKQLGNAMAASFKKNGTEITDENIKEFSQITNIPEHDLRRAIETGAQAEEIYKKIKKENPAPAQPSLKINDGQPQNTNLSNIAAGIEANAQKNFNTEKEAEKLHQDLTTHPKELTALKDKKFDINYSPKERELMDGAVTLVAQQKLTPAQFTNLTAQLSSNTITAENGVDLTKDDIRKLEKKIGVKEGTFQNLMKKDGENPQAGQTYKDPTTFDPRMNKVATENNTQLVEKGAPTKSPTPEELKAQYANSARGKEDLEIANALKSGALSPKEDELFKGAAKLRKSGELGAEDFRTLAIALANNDVTTASVKGGGKEMDINQIATQTKIPLEKLTKAFTLGEADAGKSK